MTGRSTYDGDVRFAVRRRRCRAAAGTWSIYDCRESRWLEIMFMSYEDAADVAANMIGRPDLATAGAPRRHPGSGDRDETGGDDDV